MSRIREYVPERLDEWWYEKVDKMRPLHKSYFVEGFFVNMIAIVLAWMILEGTTVMGVFAVVLLVSFRYQILSKINNVNYMTGEYKAERKMKDTMAAYLRKRNIGIRFYYVEGEKNTRLKWKTSDIGPRGQAQLKIALSIALIATLTNPGWYYQLERNELDHHEGRVSKENIDKVRQDIIPTPEVR